MISMNENKTRIFSAIGLVFFLASCAPSVIKTEKLEPAKYSETAKLRRMAVLPFINKHKSKYKHSATITEDIEAALASLQLGGEPYFNIIERTQLKKIMDEKRLGSTGLIDSRTAAKVGRIAGVQAVVFGTVSQDGIERNRHYEEIKYCSRRSKKNKCKQWSRKRVTCKTRTATFSFIPKIVGVSKANVLMSETITRQAVSKECNNEQGPSDSELLRQAKQLAIKDFTDMIAPHYKTYNLALIIDDGSNPPKFVQLRVRGGMEFARSGRIDRACQMWREASKAHLEGYQLPYLLGLCAEIDGDRREAIRQYNIADQRTLKPVKEINAALERMKKIGGVSQYKLNSQLVKAHKSRIVYSEELAIAQDRLNSLSYEPGHADGLMGSKTRSAIRSFQLDNGLRQTGKLDRETENLLLTE